MMASSFSRASQNAAMAVLSAVVVVATGFGAKADEADAKAILKSMSDYLAAEDRIAFDYDATLEVVTTDGQKLGIASSGAVTLDRPDRLRATRSNGFVDVEMLFDGTTFTLLGRDENRFTRVAIPGTIDALVDKLRDTYGAPLPAADLLLSNSYDELMEQVIDVKDLGSGMIGGSECDWLAFRTKDVDWQIWISRDGRPYPCRYVITTKQMEHSPQFTIEIRDWRAGDQVETDDFTFRSPEGATEIAIEDLRDLANELPPHLKREKK